MDVTLLLNVLTRVVAGVLTSEGKTDQADLLNDIAAAHRAGRNIDDILARAAVNWETNGEPSFDEIAATRQAIQDRMV